MDEAAPAVGSERRFTARGLRFGALAAGLLLLVVALELGGAGSGGAREAKPGAPSGAPLRVRALRAEARPLTVTARGTGEVRSRDSVVLVSEVERRLLRIHVGAGQSVKRGQLLFELDAADIRARIARLEVQRDFARRTFERLDKVVGSGAASRTEWDTARARLDELEAELAVESVNLDKTRVRAPFDATLGLVQVSEGALVNPGVPLASLFDTEHMEVDFRVPGRVSAGLRPGLTFTAQIDGEAAPRRGEIVAVEPRVEPETQSVLARGRLEAGAGGPRAGSFARVEVELAEKSALLVPAGAVVPGAEGRQVFRAVDGKAVATPVQLGERTVTEVEILSGLSVGELVLVSNLLRVRDGAPIEVEVEPSGAAAP